MEEGYSAFLDFFFFVLAILSIYVKLLFIPD